VLQNTLSRGGYNRYVKFVLICLAVLCLAGCSKNIDTPEAVKEGVIKDIAKKVDVQAMDVNVDSVSFREKEADARVSFKPKGAPDSQSITMNYSLERQGDEWRIKSRNMQAHEQQQPGQTSLPPGHPAPGAENAGPLPAGHPQVDTSQKP
jgi:hypothetical protein